MFLDRLLKTNEPLAQLAFAWQQDGTVLPDTYLIDLDMLTKNAESIKAAADAHDIKLYFMLKQLGRNPILAHHLADLGYAGAGASHAREPWPSQRGGQGVSRPALFPHCHVGHGAPHTPGRRHLLWAPRDHGHQAAQAPHRAHPGCD